MRKFLFIFTGVFLVIGLIALTAYIFTFPVAKSATLTQISTNFELCKDDVMLCENGGYAIRESGNNCQFDCNKTNSPVNGITTCPSDLRECDDGSFVIRDANNKCEFKSCQATNFL